MASQQAFSSIRLVLWRFIAVLTLSLGLVFSLSAPAGAVAVPRAYAGIVVDAKTGEVLYESSADAYRFPASVTKVMTLYVLFQEISAGHIKLTDQMTVSAHAAAAVPTKLGLKAGSKISVENAIKSIVTLSANDMARVIAEYISGSESDFATRMTKTAKSLGMNHTVYYNASGLPDARQMTTVRDQAILGIAIYQHFPTYYAYFQTRSFKYGRRTYGNHNNLLGLNGIDGIKTGYTGAAGYNLLTAARADGRHIVVAGFGFNSGASRDSKVRDLVKTYMPKARSGGYLSAALIPKPGIGAAPAGAIRVANTDPVIPMPLPSFRMLDASEATSAPEAGIGDIPPIVDVASAAPLPAERPTDLGIGEAAIDVVNTAAGAETQQDDVIGAWLSDTYSLGAPPAALGQTRASAPLVPPVGVGDSGEAIDLMTSGSVGSAASAAPAPTKEVKVASIDDSQPMPVALENGWIVQIGAAPTEAGANSLLSAAESKISQLTGFRPFVEQFVKSGQTYYRARFGGFEDADLANDMCKKLKAEKMSCLAMQS